MICDGGGWDHVSVSTPNWRVPSWKDMCWIKGLFFRPDECAVQYHPPESQYVDVAQVLHLWRPQNQAIPTPPIEMV